MSSDHPELEQEQAFVDRAYLLLDKGLADAERSMGEYQTQHRSTAQAIQRAMQILQESRGTGPTGLRQDASSTATRPLHRSPQGP